MADLQNLQLLAAWLLASRARAVGGRGWPHTALRTAHRAATGGTGALLSKSTFSHGVRQGAPKPKRKARLVPWYLFLVLFSPSCRETAKNAIKQNRRKKTTGKSVFSQLFWQNIFYIDFLQNVFCGVFELPVLRNAQKRHKSN
jgi:hypothetical protein